MSISNTSDYTDTSVTSTEGPTNSSASSISDEYYIYTCTTIPMYENYLILESSAYEEVTNYIERILKLVKWYIIYIFNCFRIRAPCIKKS